MRSRFGRSVLQLGCWLGLAAALAIGACTTGSAVGAASQGAETPQAEREMNAMIGLQGMTCQGCVQGVQGVLDRMDGVIGAEVTLEPQQATVRFDAERISLEAIRAGIEDVGYEVTGAHLQGAEEQAGAASE